MRVPADTSRSARALCAVVALVALAGCGAFLAPGPSLPEGSEAVEQFEALDSYNATYTIEITDENGTHRWTGHRTVRPSAGQFYERFENTTDGNTTIAANNGTVTWLYDVDAETVTRYSADHGQLGGTQLRQLVNNARADSSSESDPILPVGPFVPIADRSGGGPATVGPKEVSYEGTETVAGREAHVIEVTAAGDTGQFQRRYYLDTEWYVQLKITSYLDTEEEYHERELRFTDVEYEPEISDSLFEFTPPPEATVEESSIRTAVYQRREELDQDTSFSIPEPEAPDRFSFQNAQYTAATADEFGVENATDSPIETVILQYSSERSSLAIEKVNTTYDDDVEGETVEIAGRTGRYQQRAGERLVTWRCNGRVYSVSGELPREALIDVAESVVCD